MTITLTEAEERELWNETIQNRQQRGLINLVSKQPLSEPFYENIDYIESVRNSRPSSNTPGEGLTVIGSFSLQF
ncbi:MAG: hypothetical protein HC849_34425 [Oscillatoriales cyanobacterium RU_3_3]|nr:hypothetical protein [Oscillatoriales cyanobacterium RU_3_3]